MYIITAPPFKVIVEDAKPIFSINNRMEKEYNQILNAVAKNVRNILNRFNPNDPTTAIAITQALQEYTNNLYAWAKKKIGGLIYNLNKDSEAKWKRLSMMISRRLRREMETFPIDPLLDRYLLDNVGLIQSMPLKAAQKVQQVVLENLKTGEYRAEGLVDQIMNIGHVTENRANLIARTEISRMSTGLTKARSEVLNMNWYVWRATHDVRVRASHLHMDQVIVNWNDPADPEQLNHEKKSYDHYHPGEIFNCRCFPRPMVRVDDVSWPAKIYRNGKIDMMRKSDFIALSAGQIPL